MTETCEKFAYVPAKRFKRIPVYVVEEHNDALQFIYSAIGGKKLPIEGTALLHLDAHPDMLIDRKLKGDEARSGRKVLPLLQIENWILPAIAAGHIDHVVWLRPPWAKQFHDGTRYINIGDHPITGELRVDSKEPYYLSDALYSAKLENKRRFTFTSAELSDTLLKTDDFSMHKYIENINMMPPYVLDIDLDFFSTGNPFLSLYENINLYNKLLPIFDFTLPDTDDDKSIDKALASREKQLLELENLFQHLEQYDNLDNYEGEKTKLYEMNFMVQNYTQKTQSCTQMRNKPVAFTSFSTVCALNTYKVSELAASVSSEAKRLGDKPEWWAVFAAGCTRDQEGLPHHISSNEEIDSLVYKAMIPLLKKLPPPVLITVARSTDDGYCPPHQVDYIQSTVLKALKELYDTDEPALHYLTVNTL